MRIRNAMTALGLVATLATAGYATTAAATPTATANSAADTIKMFDNDYGVTRTTASNCRRSRSRR